MHEVDGTFYELLDFIYIVFLSYRYQYKLLWTGKDTIIIIY